jgi:hypothetical protein
VKECLLHRGYHRALIRVCVCARASNDEFGGSFFWETEKKKTKKKRAFVYEVSDSCLDTSVVK